MLYKKIEFWFLLLVLVGYTVFSALAIPLNIENPRWFSVPFRILIFFLSVIIIYKNFKKNNIENISIISLILFWGFYSVKTYYSFTHDFYEKEFLIKSYEIYFRIFVIILIPSLSLLVFNYKKININKVAVYSFYVLLFMLTFNFFYGLFKPHENLKFDFIFSMYYISYGHLGTSLAIFSLYFLLFDRKQYINKLILFYAFFLGVVTIFIGTARSPILALVVVFLYFFILNKKWKVLLSYIVILLFSLIGLYFYKNLGYEGITFADRTYNWIFNGDNSLRTPLFEKAIKIFKENLFIGGRTLYEDGIYPHNIFLELLMATGILGFILYFSKFLPLFSNLKQIFLSNKINTYHLFFGLFIQYFVLAFTSYSIFSVPEFLYFSSIVLGMNPYIDNEKT